MCVKRSFEHGIRVYVHVAYIHIQLNLVKINLNPAYFSWTPSRVHCMRCLLYIYMYICLRSVVPSAVSLYIYAASGWALHGRRAARSMSVYRGFCVYISYIDILRLCAI